MEFTRFNDEEGATTTTRTDFKKRAAAAATGVLAIAAVACVALLFINSGSATTDLSEGVEQTTTLSNLRGANQFLGLDLSSQVTELLQFKSSFGISQKRLFNTVIGIAKGDPATIQRVGTLVLKYTFDLIDSNNNDSVSKSEWEAFFTGVFPQDTATFNPLFAEVNKGSDFTFDEYVAFVGARAQNQSELAKLKPVTNPKVTQIALAKLVLNDDRNYELTYQVVFQVFDENNDQSLTKAELKNVLIAFGSPPPRAAQDSNKVFAFAKQNKLSDDGNTIAYAKYTQFAVAIRKPLQDQLSHAQTFLQLQLTKNELTISKLQLNASPLMALAYEHAFNSIEKQTTATLTPEQQKVVNYLFQTITQYEFSLLDTDGNKVVTQKEFRAVIDQLFKNADDQKHYYANFDAVNGGKDVTLQQFQDQIVKKVQSPSQAYVPKEKKELIERRAGTFIINNKQNYALTYNFVFNLFDVNQDKVVSVTEIHNTAVLFVTNKTDLANVDTNVQKVFTALQSAKVGDGKQITLAQWQAFALQVQPQLAQALQNATNTLMFLSL